MMSLKKPKFWDLKKPNIIAYLLLPIALLIQTKNFFKIRFKKKKIKNKNYLCWEYLYWWNGQDLFMYQNK